ncbi:MAG TPA: SPOR domain-containing protein [Gemmatimonadaceae bacterium]|nr:SPOR domain-containing protein [Gemmatimonadaceae bacterium]
MTFTLRVTKTLLAMSIALAPGRGHSQNVDTAMARIERLVVAGDRSSARYLTDSLLATLPHESPRIADALYWRAATAPSAVDAERDYLRITVEHPYSRRAPDALLALAQLEFARGNRSAARRRFDRLLRDYPSGKHVARASLWSGRLAIEERDMVAGCATLDAGLPHIAAEDVELRNQFEYFVSQCERLPAAPADTLVVAPPADSAPAKDAAFSVQVAAYTAQRDATSLAAHLKQRGFDARVVGDKAPYRVRVGRYATREEASAALTKMKAARVSGLVVEAESR